MQFKILFLAIIFFGLLGYYLIHGGLYPVAIVNGSPIWARDLIIQRGAAIVYYQNALRVSFPEGSKDLTEIRRAALDKLIENVLIYKELRNRVGAELGGLVDRKMPVFKDSVAAIYGLTPAKFKELVLEPQARRELLEGRLFLDKESLGDWLWQARKKANVIILSSRLGWNGSGTVSNR